MHKLLSGEGITPLIQMRALWQTDPERMLPGHDGSSNVVYTEDGTIYCYDKVSEPPVRHPMAYIGHEPERETLKYRCPAKHEGWDCPMSKICNAGKSYGKTVRVDREIDLRRFPSLPRATKKFERMYKGRTSVERVNARLKVFWGVDDGNLTGSRRFVAPGGRGAGGARGVRDAVGLGAAARGDAGQSAAEPDRRSPASQGQGGPSRSRQSPAERSLPHEPRRPRSRCAEGPERPRGVTSAVSRSRTENCAFCRS